MKHLLITTLLSLAPFCANAIVADEFKCNLKIEDQTTGDINSQDFSFHVARLPLVQSPASDIKVSYGNTYYSSNFTTKNNQIFSNLNFYYSHATKVNAAGHVTDARQKTCVTLSVSACTRSPGDPSKPCSNFVSYCPEKIEPADPFLPGSGWSEVGFIDDVPFFLEKSLSVASAHFVDENSNPVGTAIVDCKFAGTYQ